jgi:16S rRNA (guanine1516-N2)-methyltransferase
MQDDSKQPVYLFQKNALHQQETEALAKQFELPCTDIQPVNTFYLTLTEQGLELHQPGKQAPGPIYVDFVGGALGHRRHYGGGRSQPLARAMGLKSGYNPAIVDLTAGLGRDAFVLASLGCKITLCERSPILAALLYDGLRRGEQDSEVADIMQHMTLWHGDSCEYLAGLKPDQQPDVIYLDPMYPESPSTAAVKKDMAALHQLIGPDTDSEKLLDLALATALKRVVIKRPKHADWLHQHKPHTSIESKKTRYDIYMARGIASLP